MQAYYWVAIVTLVTGLVYFAMAVRVVVTRRRVGIFAPTMTGDPRLERTIRAHTNMLEWLPIFLPSLWLFAIYWDARIAAALGALWITGRIVYFFGYVADAPKRLPGFFIQSTAVFALLLGALGRILYLAMASSA